MPRGDRTGPLGEGPMTGRQLGYGAGYNSPGFTRGAGRGWWRGFFGGGRGRGFYWAGQSSAPDVRPDTPERFDELSNIRSEMQALKNSLSTILKRLDMLNAETRDK